MKVQAMNPDNPDLTNKLPVYRGSRRILFLSLFFLLFLIWKEGKYYLQPDNKLWSDMVCVLWHSFEQHPLRLCRLDGFLKYRCHANFRTRASLSECQDQYHERSFAENLFLLTEQRILLFSCIFEQRFT